MIVKTLLDTDLYKFTTSYAYIKLFPYAMGTFSFNDRNETQYTKDFLKALKAEIKNLSQLRYTEEELEYMTKNCRFLPRVYWEWLSSFRFDPNKIDIHLDEACHLHIEVTDFIRSAFARYCLRNQKPFLWHCSRHERDSLQAVGENRIVESTSASLFRVRHTEKILH